MRTRSSTTPTVLGSLILLAVSCSGARTPGETPHPPGWEPKDATKCHVKASQTKPLVVEWRGEERGALETQARKGLIVVRYDGCEMEVLSRCTAPATYQYAGMNPQKSTESIRNADELYAAVPIGAARLEGKLQQFGELNVKMTMVGRWEAANTEIEKSELQGAECEKATHVVSGMTVGAFTFFAGASSEDSAGVNVAGLGGGAKSARGREALSQAGDPGSCEKAKDSDTAPVTNCSAVIRVEVVELRATRTVAPGSPPVARQSVSVATDIDQRLAKFAQLDMTFDDALIPAEDHALIKKLVEVNQLVHELFIQQIDPNIPSMRAQLAADPSKAAALGYFDIMAGPWDALANDEPFVGSKKRPAGGTWYPADLTRQQFEQWIGAHSSDKDAFQDFFTVIRRNDGNLIAVPYSQAYRSRLTVLAAKLREAAALAREPSLKKFLAMRADAFLSNQYRESDKAWLDVAGRYEITIGPYETYADQLLGLKASFESFISVRDQAESRKLQVVGKKMDALENNLPIPQDVRAKMAGRSQGSPIDVVHLLCNSGQAGVQTVAYNLPNDDQVRNEKGSKKVMLKNVVRGKFDRIVLPIAERVLTAETRKHLSFDAMFTSILMHEVAHGLGPGIMKNADGTTTEVQKALKELYGGIEEAKADAAGLVSAQYLIDTKVLPTTYEREIYVAYLATVFRQVRFGVNEAHSRAAIASFNYLVDKGGIVYDRGAGRYAVDYAKIKGAVRDLAGEYLTIEGRGDYDGAKRFLEQHAIVSPDMQKALDSLRTGIPVDFAPNFTIYSVARTW